MLSYKFLAPDHGAKSSLKKKTPLPGAGSHDAVVANISIPVRKGLQRQAFPYRD
jgi:hypothetical protein